MSILKSKTSLKKAPKVNNPDVKNNFMREYDTSKGKKSPMSGKRLSK